MTAILVDDNQAIRETLNTLLTTYAPDVEVIAEASGVKEGLELIRRLHPDLVFLDVEMQDGTGFDLLSQYGEVDFRFVFVTGHDQFAIKAFKFSAIDYVLKPVDPDDLLRAIDKCRTLSMEINSLKTKTFINNHQLGDKHRRLVLNDAKNTYLIHAKDIVRCQADVNYTKVYLSDGKELTISKTLKSFDEMLSEMDFFRSHQSHLINLQYFDRLDKSEGGIIYLSNGESVPISTRKREGLLTGLANFK